MRSGGEKRGNNRDRKARKLWMLATFDPELGPDAVRCRLVLSERCLGELDYATVTADRIDQGGTYARHNVQPACKPCQSLQGGHANVRLMGPIIDAYRSVRDQWEIRFDLETNQSYYPGVIEIERGKERRGGRREVTDWLEENPPPTWREFLVEWASSRREQEAS